MSEESTAGTVPAAKHVDRLCDEFERGWVSGCPDRIEDVVFGSPEPLRGALFRELLAVECEYRAKEGRPVTLDEARGRFARLGPWAGPAVEELLASRGGQGAGGGGLTQAAFPPRPAGHPVSVGKFRIVGELGSGGMGVVYLAEDPDGLRRVAVKVLRPEYAADRTARERFLREARSAMTIEHDHVVPVYQVEENAGNPFLVMPALRGESLEDRLNRDPQPPVGLVVKVGREVALGLAVAHEKGLVHRDVKPGNIWLEGDPSSSDPAAQVRRVKLLDFGLTRRVSDAGGVSAVGLVAGTPQYMAPEQAAGRPVDARADLFSLGAVLYRMAARRPAFPGLSTVEVLTAVATDHPPPVSRLNPAVPPPVSALIDRLLAKRPARRPGSAAEVADALASVGRDGPPAARNLRPWRWGPAALAAATLLFGAVVGLWPPRPPRPPAGVVGPPTGGSDKAAALPPPAVGYGCRVDLLVEREDRLVRLNRPGALPLKADDGYVVEATADPPAYLYVVWVDPGRDVTPVYPWDPTGGHGKSDPWDTRPAAESPVAEVRVPAPGRVYYAPDAKPGVATVVLFARPAPLGVSADVVRGWFESLPELELAPDDEGAAVWFADFRKVTGDDRRRGTFRVRDQDDPFAAWQRLLFRSLGAHAACQSAVSFARTGNSDRK